MNLIKQTSLESGITIATDKYGYEHILVVAKGTFTIRPNRMCVLSKEQEPLIDADEFYGIPGASSVRYESDFVLFKPRCDVLLNGSAYAPQGKATTKVIVGLQVGALTKSFEVIGNRVWKKNLLFVSSSHPQPFDKMPITYDRAFGGTDCTEKNPENQKTYMENPVGVGFYPLCLRDHLVGKPLPNTQEPGSPTNKRTGTYRPMAFGPIGRNWSPRYRLAGTYDQHWLNNVFPFLPADFSDLYYQAAPVDQQIDYLQGGEEVELINLTPEGRLAFTLPQLVVTMNLVVGSKKKYLNPVLDTLIIEPDFKRCLLVWRASDRLKVKPIYVKEVQVTSGGPGLKRAMETGKRYFRGCL